MRLHAILCVLSTVAARVGGAAPADGNSAASTPPTGTASAGQTGAGQPETGFRNESGVVNPNGIFGNYCSEGFVLVNRECVRTETRGSAGVAAPLPPPSPNVDDFDDFIKSLGVDDEFAFLGDDAGSSTMKPAPAVAPADPTPDPRVATPRVKPNVVDFVDSLSDTEFLTELLRGVEEEEDVVSPTAPTSVCTHGLVLVSVGAVLLLAALVLALWTGLRCRQHRAAATHV